MYYFILFCIISILFLEISLCAGNVLDNIRVMILSDQVSKEKVKKISVNIPIDLYQQLLNCISGKLTDKIIEALTQYVEPPEELDLKRHDFISERDHMLIVSEFQNRNIILERELQLAHKEKSELIQTGNLYVLLFSSLISKQVIESEKRKSFFEKIKDVLKRN